MKIDRACYERGCACYDDRIDKDPVEVVKREWVGLTNDDWVDILNDFDYDCENSAIVKRIEEILKRKNT